MEQICPNDKCFGCSICAGICPTDAITMTPMELGHVHPVIDQTKCIDCKKCERYCPVNNKLKLKSPNHTYAAWANDFEQHSTSTSGGISACLADYVIDEFKGVIYGCASLPNGTIEHIKVEDKKKALLIKGSKYVQSKMTRELIQSILSNLKVGRKVLFLGTPCQVAAIKSIGKPFEENLFCVDLICHGVPSQEFLFRYIAELGITKDSIESISFRNTKGYCLKVTSSIKTYQQTDLHDLYLMAFNDNIIFRQSCYNCPFSNKYRIGDITIGDFWGLGNKIPFEHKTDGNISVVLVNSEKGDTLINSLNSKNKLTLIARNLDEAVEGNHNLQRPSIPKGNLNIVRYYNDGNLIKGLKKSLRKRRIKCIVMPLIQKTLHCINKFK